MDVTIHWRAYIGSGYRVGYKFINFAEAFIQMRTRRYPQYTAHYANDKQEVYLSAYAALALRSQKAGKSSTQRFDLPMHSVAQKVINGSGISSDYLSASVLSDGERLSRCPHRTEQACEKSTLCVGNRHAIYHRRTCVVRQAKCIFVAGYLGKLTHPQSNG